ncbi:MAG: ATP-binding cassette domain-containing protein, partial [Clostridia bacterium]|nr:ATP-binding cassette domain-containing protein [Clostridia bacterium]
MINVNDLSFNFGGQLLFKHVDLQFTPGNCYGVIGANGAGKSTFLRILCGELEPSSGSVSIAPNTRMSVLKQDHFAYDEYTVLDTVIMGNPKLYEVMKEKDALYMKEDFSDEDGVRASELEGIFAEMNGWEAESDASRLIKGLGLKEEILYSSMADLKESEKIKVLLAQALFGNPDIILLDEPTNGLDLDAVMWLEDFLSDYFGTVLVVSHDRHFLNDVCTNIVDIDFSGIKMYVGNYEFWYESSQLMQRLIKQQNKKNEEKIRELQEFISRFSANKSKSRQATSRRKLLDKLTVEEIPASSRRYPFIGFECDREAGKDILEVTGLSKSLNGQPLFENLSFTLNRNEKVALVGNELAITSLFRILMEEDTPDSGEFKWGQSITTSYFPHDNTAYFDDCNDSIIDWMRQYSKDQT